MLITGETARFANIIVKKRRRPDGKMNGAVTAHEYGGISFALCISQVDFFNLSQRPIHCAPVKNWIY